MKSPIKSFYDWYRNTLRHPQYRWLLIFGTIFYLISPIDIAPDLFPIVGQVDDLMLLTLLLSELSQIVFDFFKLRQGKESGVVGEGDSTATVNVDAYQVK